MAEKYPALAVEEVEEMASAPPEFSPGEIASLPQLGLKNFLADAHWVYENLEAEDINVADIPSAGALALLSWARANKDDFFGRILPRTLERMEKQQTKVDAEADMERASREHIDYLMARAGESVR
jgi:hypothetical protein